MKIRAIVSPVIPCWCHKCFHLGAIVTASVARCWHSDVMALGHKRRNHPWRQTLRAVPEIILGVGHIFFQTPPPPGHIWSQSPPQPWGHPHPTMDQICLDPQDKLPPPPLRYVVNKTPSPSQDKKVPAAPQDDFWNSPKWVRQWMLQQQLA